MSNNDYSIEVDDLILFFRGVDKDNQETIVNRLIPHNTYANEKRRLPEKEIREGWRDSVLSDPSVSGNNDQHFYVANLARLVPPNESRKPADSHHPPADPVKFAPGDLVVFPPEDSGACFLVPRKVYEECQENCRELPANVIPDLEFMVREEGVVLANVPKVTPQGCTCIPLSLVGLRSGMLKGPDNKGFASKLEHAHNMHKPMSRGHKPRNGNP
jgi:hypothetical protein